MNSSYPNRMIAWALSLWVFALAGGPARGAATNGSMSVVSAYNQFGYELFALTALSHQDTNVFISPTSAAFALAAVCSGAQGQTKAEIERVLRISSIQNWHEQNRELLHQLLVKQEGINLEIANGIWVRKSPPIKSDFIAGVRNFMDAEVFAVDFAASPVVAQINAWANERTHGHVPQIIEHLDGKGDTVRTVLVDLNATYFKGNWQAPFSEQLTKNEEFHLPDGQTIKHPRMQQSGRFLYCTNSLFQMVSLPYGNKGTPQSARMVIFLPRDKTVLNNFLSVMTERNVNSWLSQMKLYSGDVALPKFKLQCSTELKAPLTLMGIRTGFDAKANFSGICQGVSISQAAQKVVIDVNEKGTEAAAVTDFVIAKSRWEPEFSMIVDRPFCFAIIHRTGAILFWAAVADPR